MKPNKILFFAFSLLLSLQIVFAGTTTGNFTNPLQGQDIETSMNITWTDSVPTNASTFINYYNLTLRNSTSTVVSFSDNQSYLDSGYGASNSQSYFLLGNTTVNRLVATVNESYYSGHASCTAYVNVTFVYYDGTQANVEIGTTSTSPSWNLFNNPNPTKRVTRVESYGKSCLGITSQFSGYRFTGTHGNHTSYYLNVSNFYITLGEYSLVLTTLDNYGSVNASIDVNITKGAKRLTTNFIDQATGSTLSGTVNIDFISDSYSVSKTINSGTVNIILAPDTYQIRYSSTGYDTRFYYFTFSNTSDETINLYLINQSLSQNVTYTVIDESTNPVEGASVKALKYDITSNTYIVQEIGRTDIQGKTILHLTNDEFYKIMVEYDGILYLTTTPAYVTQEAYTLQIILFGTTGSEYYNYLGLTKDVSFISATDSFRLTYNDPSNTVSTVCLNIVRLGRGIVNMSCTDSSSLTITLGIVPVNGSTFTATAYRINDDGTKEFLASESYTYPKTTNMGRFGILIQILITAGMAVLIIVDMSLALVAIPASLLLGYWLGLHTLALTSIVALTVVGIILAYVVRRSAQ